jgi:hypothetical protein
MAMQLGSRCLGIIVGIIETGLQQPKNSQWEPLGMFDVFIPCLETWEFARLLLLLFIFQ